MFAARFLPIVLLSVSLIAGLGACQNGGLKETLGTLGGAAAGGLIGSQIGDGKGQLIATGAGVLLGAFVGREIGKSLDHADRLAADQAASEALENNQTGESVSWNNPDSGNSGSVTPTRTTYLDSGEPCREYQTTITVGGQTEEAYGTACRNPDGSWRIVN